MKSNMKRLTCLLIFTLAITFLSCQKENDILPDEDSQALLMDANGLKATVLNYDNFFDDFDWTFAGSDEAPTPTYTLCNYSDNNRWAKVTWIWQPSWTCTLYPGYATVTSGLLNLEAPGLYKPEGSQIQTLRNDYWYGSYRVTMKTASHFGAASEGTVNAFFFYSNPSEQEIDIEILSKDNGVGKGIVHFVTHPSTRNTDIAYTLNFDPSAGYNEYGFDWYRDKVEFFVNKIKVKTQKLAVPSATGNIMLNHWTGNPNWGGTAEPLRSEMLVDNVWHAPFILVTNPDNSGLSWTRGTTLGITWNKYGDVASSTVNIELWKDGSFYKTIKSKASNSGSYNWVIPSTTLVSSNYLVKVKSNLNLNYYDISNNPFTIK
jgi:beta-glucanase (GH16 family)